MPAGVVNTVPDMLQTEQVAHRGIVMQVPPPTGLSEPMSMINASFRLNEGSPGIDQPPPHVGQHTDAVLSDFGFSEAEISQLRADGAIG